MYCRTPYLHVNGTLGSGQCRFITLLAQSARHTCCAPILVVIGHTEVQCEACRVRSMLPSAQTYRGTHCGLYPEYRLSTPRHPSNTAQQTRLPDQGLLFIPKEPDPSVLLREYASGLPSTVSCLACRVKNPTGTRRFQYLIMESEHQMTSRASGGMDVDC